MPEIPVEIEIFLRQKILQAFYVKYELWLNLFLIKEKSIKSQSILRVKEILILVYFRKYFQTSSKLQDSVLDELGRK